VTDTLTRTDVVTPVSMTRYEADFAGFARDLGESFERYGFAVVADHGLDPGLLDGALERTKAFFALADAVKSAYHVEGGGGQRGYTPFGVETAKGAVAHDLKEFWHVGRELPPGHPYARYMPPNVWPAEVDGFQAYLSGVYQALDVLGGRLLQAVAQHLRLPRDWFDGKVELGNSILRLLHYPPAPFDGANIRAAAHEDINVITLLLGAEEAGLELLTREGRWLPIAPPPGAVVCNIGDMLQRLTNGVLPSTTHRVVNPPAERRGVSRYSTPFFLHLEPEVVIETLPGCLRPGEPAPEPITAHAFLQERPARDQACLGSALEASAQVHRGDVGVAPEIDHAVAGGLQPVSDQHAAAGDHVRGPAAGDHDFLRGEVQDAVHLEFGAADQRGDLFGGLRLHSHGDVLPRSGLGRVQRHPAACLELRVGGFALHHDGHPLGGAQLALRDDRQGSGENVDARRHGDVAVGGDVDAAAIGARLERDGFLPDGEIGRLAGAGRRPGQLALVGIVHLDWR
jgi:isopenicillin N synthase-like dioxygenase